MSAVSYQDYIFSTVKVEKGLKVVVDAGNGVGGLFALPLLERYGCRVTPIYCDVDGRLPEPFSGPHGSGKPERNYCPGEIDRRRLPA